MKSTNRRKKIQSWIPQEFEFAYLPETFPVVVSVPDPDVVEFISRRELQIEIFATKQMMMFSAEQNSLKGQLLKAVWDKSKLTPNAARLKIGACVSAYCRGVYWLVEKKELCIFVSRTPESVQPWYSKRLKFEADLLLHEHNSKLAEFNENIRLKKLANQELKQKIKEHYPSEEKFGVINDAVVAAEELHQRPKVTAETLLEWLPKAVNFPFPLSTDAEKFTRSAMDAIAATSLRPPRDGNYSVIILENGKRKKLALVSWIPHTGLPSYSEIRWAIQKHLPLVLRKPRIEQMGKPKFEQGSQLLDNTVHGINLGSNNIEDALDDLRLDESDYRNRVDNIRKDVKEQGFEALAWFQPFHVWTEETWGIYIDSAKLDDLALSFFDDFKLRRLHGLHSHAALLAFGLTYAHELFHARVEAGTSWQELNAQQPRYLRYQERVYHALRETPDWLEEALANWSSWSWYKGSETQKIFGQISPKTDVLDQVVAASLDFAPPGYKEWRLGDKPETWRKFANQLSTGKPLLNNVGIGLPIENVLTGPLPYDFLSFDIPLRFVGSGAIADRLKSHPATFNVPARRELERALKYFRHKVDPSGGKGGHQKWTGPDQRAFILPTRDPVSSGVFKTFLHHVGIDKATYVYQVRPKL